MPCLEFWCDYSIFQIIQNTFLFKIISQARCPELVFDQPLQDTKPWHFLILHIVALMSEKRISCFFFKLHLDVPFLNFELL